MFSGQLARRRILGLAAMAKCSMDKSGTFHPVSEDCVLLDIIRPADLDRRRVDLAGDRKSTRLNSSHQIISYAVFCLKKKKKYKRQLNQDVHISVCRTTHR